MLEDKKERDLILLDWLYLVHDTTNNSIVESQGLFRRVQPKHYDPDPVRLDVRRREETVDQEIIRHGDLSESSSTFPSYFPSSREERGRTTR